MNMNFNAVNPLFASGRGADRQPLRAQGVTDAEIAKRHDAARRVFDALIPELVRLAQVRPDDRFVVRPHPFERADVYRQRFAGLANVVVDPEGERWTFADRDIAKARLHRTW